jgi:hypothetical protein
MCERRHDLAARMRKLRRDAPHCKGRPRETTHTHEIETRDRIAFDELEGEQSNHSCKPRSQREIPEIMKSKSGDFPARDEMAAGLRL